MVQQIQIELPMPAIEEFCKRWAIREFALFGSVLRDDFRPDSDIDVMVTFDPSSKRGLLALARMQRELVEIMGRHVDLVERDGVEQARNARKGQHILQSARVVYAAN
jgi:predicted nucleotidyltransferase